MIAYANFERMPVSANCLYSPHNLYIMLEGVEIEWEWQKWEVRQFDKYLKKGFGLGDTKQLSEVFDRTEEEIGLMMIDRNLIDGIAKDIAGNYEPYIMLENVKINWFWDKRDVVMFDLFHKSGISVQSLADRFGRTEAEIIIMIFDRALQGKLV